MEQKYLIVDQNLKMKQNLIKPGIDVVIQKEALLSTLFSDNVVIITECDWTCLRNPIVLFAFWQMFCIIVYEHTTLDPKL